jgi:hypothetical protein
MESSIRYPVTWLSLARVWRNKSISTGASTKEEIP